MGKAAFAAKLAATIPHAHIVDGGYRVFYVSQRPEDNRLLLDELPRDASVVDQWQGRLVVYPAHGIALETLGPYHLNTPHCLVFGDPELLPLMAPLLVENDCDPSQE